MMEPTTIERVDSLPLVLTCILTPFVKTTKGRTYATECQRFWVCPGAVRQPPAGRVKTTCPTHPTIPWVVLTGLLP